MTRNKKQNKMLPIGIIVNGVRGDPKLIVKKIKGILKNYNIKTIVVDYDITYSKNIKKAIKDMKEASMLISIGGDGTLLSALKIAIKYDIAVLPIYHGTLGFISEIPPEEAFLILEGYLKGKNELYKIEDRTLLSVNIENKNNKKDYLAVNELVLSKPAGRPVYLKITISGRVVSSLVGDGVVIATPTGSTAYALSSGGPILSPRLNAIAFVPIAPHSLTFRPLVIPKGDNITIELIPTSMVEAMITIDGDAIYKLKKGDIVRAEASDKNCHIFQSGSRIFYDILRDKLNWGR